MLNLTRHSAQASARRFFKDKLLHSPVLTALLQGDQIRISFPREETFPTRGSTFAFVEKKEEQIMGEEMPAAGGLPETLTFAAARRPRTRAYFV